MRLLLDTNGVKGMQVDGRYFRFILDTGDMSFDLSVEDRDVHIWLVSILPETGAPFIKFGEPDIQLVQEWPQLRQYVSTSGGKGRLRANGPAMVTFEEVKS